MLDVAIIGAGLAGIHCALRLQKQGFRVELFDKSRGIGGRLATRRIHDIPLDHGLSSWQIMGEYTAALTPELERVGLLQSWRIAQTETNDPHTWQHLTTTQAWMAPAGMTAIAKHLAQGLTIHRAYHLSEIQFQTDHWQLTFQNGEAIAVKGLILALPMPQVITLIDSIITVRDRPPLIQYDAALSLMIGFDQPLDHLDQMFPWQELRLEQHPIFQKIIRDGQKRSPQQSTLVVQTNDPFTQPYLDTPDLNPVTEQLIHELQTLLNLPTPSWSALHRWRYAIPKHNLGQPHLKLETALPCIACGDWCLGHGIEGAIASGYAAANTLMSQINPSTD